MLSLEAITGETSLVAAMQDPKGDNNDPTILSFACFESADLPQSILDRMLHETLYGKPKFVYDDPVIAKFVYDYVTDPDVIDCEEIEPGVWAAAGDSGASIEGVSLLWRGV